MPEDLSDGTTGDATIVARDIAAGNEIDRVLPAVTDLYLDWKRSSPTSCIAHVAYGRYLVVAAFGALNEKDGPATSCWIASCDADLPLRSGAVKPNICRTLVEAMVACERHFAARLISLLDDQASTSV